MNPTPKALQWVEACLVVAMDECSWLLVDGLWLVAVVGRRDGRGCGWGVGGCGIVG